MTDTNQLPPMPSHDEHFMTCAHVYTADQMRAYALQARTQVQGELEPYDAGLLNDFGGGNIEWWQDYIRAELGRAHDFYQSQIATPQPAQATQAEVDDADIDAATRHIYHNGRPTSKEYRVGIARAILALRPERVQMTGEQWTDVLGSAGPDLLDLAKQWSDNKVHVYQVVNEAEKIVKAAVLRGITAHANKETP